MKARPYILHNDVLIKGLFIKAICRSLVLFRYHKLNTFNGDNTCLNIFTFVFQKILILLISVKGYESLLQYVKFKSILRKVDATPFSQSELST